MKEIKLNTHEKLSCLCQAKYNFLIFEEIPTRDEINFAIRIGQKFQHDLCISFDEMTNNVLDFILQDKINDRFDNMSLFSTYIDEAERDYKNYILDMSAENTNIVK